MSKVNKVTAKSPRVPYWDERCYMKCIVCKQNFNGLRNVASPDICIECSELEREYPFENQDMCERCDEEIGEKYMVQNKTEFRKILMAPGQVCKSCQNRHCLCEQCEDINNCCLPDHDTCPEVPSFQ
mgnify:CR=1 FL=1